MLQLPLPFVGSLTPINNDMIPDAIPFGITLDVDLGAGNAHSLTRVAKLQKGKPRNFELIDILEGNLVINLHVTIL